MRPAGWFFIVVFAGATALPLEANDGNWPQWRGPSSQGVSADPDAPREWTPETNVAWKTAIPGRGHSSPVIWGARVFLTTAIEGDVVPGHGAVAHTVGNQEFVHPDAVSGDRAQTLKVLALDVDTGAIVWERTAYAGPMYDSRHRRGSFASATPVTDGEAVYVSFGSEGVYAYAFDGTLKWKADIGRIRTLGLGTASSPVLFDRWVILQCDENEGEKSFLVALDKATGQEAWRTSRPVQVSWSTPVLVDANGRPELVTNGTEFVIAYDPRTGRELWRSKGVESNAIHTPLVGHGLVFVSAGFPVKKTIAIRPGARATSRAPTAWCGPTTGARPTSPRPSSMATTCTHRRQRSADVPRRPDGGREVRGRPRPGACPFHGLAARHRRHAAAHQRGRRHLRRQGRTRSRDRADELHRRARTRRSPSRRVACSCAGNATSSAFGGAGATSTKDAQGVERQER